MTVKRAKRAATRKVGFYWVCPRGGAIPCPKRLSGFFNGKANNERPRLAICIIYVSFFDTFMPLTIKIMSGQ
jgi:hypothetical protein